LPAGTYEVAAALPPGLAMTTSSPRTTTLLPGESDLTLDFGYIAPTAVDLVSFSAERNDEGVLVQWLTAHESDMAGFYLWRNPVPDHPGKRITTLLPAINQGGGQQYHYLDRTVDGGVWYYWLEAVDLAGTSEFFGPISVPVPGKDTTHALYFSLILR
jgi:hypothetical protein